MLGKRNHELEELTLLYSIIKDDNDGDLVKSRLELDFFKRCLNIQKSASLSTNLYRRNGQRKGIYLDAMEDMIDLGLQDYYEHGYSVFPTETINKSDFDYALWDFTFTYIKQKGKNGKLRNHQDVITITARDEEIGRLSLNSKLKKLNETLIEIVSVSKIVSIIITKDGIWHNADNVELAK